MLSNDDIQAELKKVLPPELHLEIPRFADIIGRAISKTLPANEAQELLSANSKFAPILSALTQQPIMRDEFELHVQAANLTSEQPGGNLIFQINTRGGDYAEGSIDKRQGIFIEVTLPPPEIPPPLPVTTPPEIQDFIGRDTELGDLRARVAADHFAILIGEPGVGKTALAAAITREFVGVKPIFWHTFREGHSVDLLIAELASFLAHNDQPSLWKLRYSGSKRDQPLEELDRLVPLLSGQGYLLVFDDLQYLEWQQGDPLITELLERLVGVARRGLLDLVITTEQPISSLRNMGILTIQGLNQKDTSELLLKRISHLDAQQIAELYRQTAGNAQLLNLAATALQGEDPTVFLRDLAIVNNVASYLLERVDQHLTPDERDIMSVIAILSTAPSEGSTRQAIEAVGHMKDSYRLLVQLKDKHLLTVGMRGADQFYAQRPTIQAFYYQSCDEEERRMLHQRAGEHFTHTDQDNLLAVLHFARAKDYIQAVNIATTNTGMIINRGQSHQLTELLKGFSARQLDDDQWVAVQIALGEVSTQLREIEVAEKCFRTALEHLDALPESLTVQQRRLQVFLDLGILLEFDAPDEALRWLHHGLDAVSENDKIIRGSFYRRLGSVLIEKNDLDDAKDALNQSLSLLPVRATVLRADIFLNLGIVKCQQGRLLEGKEYFRRVLALYQEAHNDWGSIGVHQNIANIMDIRGEWSAAIAELKDAQELAEKVGHVIRQNELKLNWGILETRRGDFQSARSMLSDSLALAQKHNFRSNTVRALSSLADLEIRLANLDAAERALQEAEQVARKLGNKSELSEIYRTKAQIYLARGTLPKATTEAQKAVKAARALNDPLAEGMSRRILAQVLFATQDAEKGLRAFKQSLKLLDSEDPYEAARTKMEWGRALLQIGHNDQGRAMLLQARAEFERLGAKYDLEEVDKLLA